MLFHIHLFGVLIAVHIDVDDVLTFAETGTVEGELAGAGLTLLFCTFVDISLSAGHQCHHLNVLSGIVIDGDHVAAVILQNVVGKVVADQALAV